MQKERVKVRILGKVSTSYIFFPIIHQMPYKLINTIYDVLFGPTRTIPPTQIIMQPKQLPTVNRLINPNTDSWTGRPLVGRMIS